MESTIDRRNRNTDAGNLGDWGRVLRVIFFSAVLATSGCSFLPSHFHDAEKAAVATKLEKELTAYEENAPSMYEAMLANLEKFRVEEDRLIADLAANRDSAFVTALPIDNWNELCGCGNIVAKNIIGLKKLLREKAEDYQKNSPVLTGEIQTAEKTLENTQTAVDDAKKSVNRWNESIALLKKGFAKLPALAGNNKSGSAKGDLGSLIKEAGEEEVEFLDADGKSQKRKIKDILEDQIKSGGGDGGWFSSLLPEAPGVTVTIVTLGLDLAELKKKEAEFQLTQLLRRAELYEETYGKIRLASQLLMDSEFVMDSELAKGLTEISELEKNPEHEKTLLEQNIEQCKKKKEFDGSSYRYVLKSVSEARSLYQKVGEVGSNDSTEAEQTFFGKTLRIKGVLRRLRKLALADSITIRTEAVLKMSTVRLDHEESILSSRVHDEMWRAALRSGISGLVAYHQGGFSAEDAAQIIRIAQTVALGIIAQGVN